MLGLLARLAGPARWARLIEAWARWRLGLPAMRRALASNLRRIRAHAAGPQTPGPTEEAVDAYVRAVAGHYARERATLHRVSRGGGAPAGAVDLALLPALRALLAEGRGTVLATPHFGNLVAGVAALGTSGVPVTMVVVEAAPYGWVRGRAGVRFVSVGRAGLDCLEALRRGEAVVVYTDLDFFPAGRTRPFFGVPFNPPHGAVRLAREAGSPILPVYVVHEGGRDRFEADEPIAAGTPQGEAEEALLRSMERWISRYPDQWLILRDAWDLEARRRENRGQLHALRLLEEARRAIGLR